jgi:hypothetical protein
MDQKVIYVGEQTCRWVSSTGLLISCGGRNQFSRMRKCAAPSLRHCPHKCVAPSLRHYPATTKHSGTVKETETVPYNAQCRRWQQCIVLVNHDDGVVHSNIHCNNALWVVGAWGGARIKWIFKVGRPCNWRRKKGRNQCIETVYVIRTSWCPNKTIPPNTTVWRFPPLLLKLPGWYEVGMLVGPAAMSRENFSLQDVLALDSTTDASVADTSFAASKRLRTRALGPCFPTPVS